MNYASKYCVPFSFIVFCVALVALLYTPSTLSIFEIKRAQAAESIPSIIYGGTGFTESVANDGSVTGAITATLFEDTFQDTDADNILDVGSEVTVNNIPAGLTPVVTLTASPTSTEPTSWISATVPTGTWNDITYGDGTFVAVGDNVLMYSYDGITWASTTVPGIGIFTTVTYGDGKFVALGPDLPPIYSTNGITWTLGGGDYETGFYESVVYGNGVFLAQAGDPEDSLFTYSFDGITWFDNLGGPGRTYLHQAFGNGVFVALNGNPNKYSFDGLNWLNGSSTVGSRGITYGNGRFVSVTDSGTNRVSYSIDGITWTAATAAEQNTWRDITYGNGKFVAVSQDGTNRVMYSIDGITWTAATAAAQNTWQNITYGDGKFVALDGTNRVMYSSGPAPDKIATLTLTDNASAHESANDVSNITFTFDNSAFISAVSAGAILNATGPASSGRGIDFENVAVVVAPPSSGGGGGGGGGSSRYCDDPKANNYKPEGKGKASASVCRYDTKTTTSTSTPVSAETNAIRQSLLSQIAQLQALLAKLQSGSGSTASAGTGSGSIACVYSRNLTLQMVGEDVKCLQKYLNNKGYTIATIGSGAPGFESTYFGIATQNALKRFQNDNAAAVLSPVGLTAGTGYFGAITRDFVTKNP